MTIKGLLPFLRDNCPGAFIELEKSKFRGSRVAIDADNILHKFMSTAHRDVVNSTDVCTTEPDRDEIIKKWLIRIKKFVLDLLHNGTIPLFIFDGDKRAVAKTKTRAKRRESKQKQIDKMEELKAKILKLDLLERTPDMTTELRKKMQNLGFVCKEDKEIAMAVLSGIGIPVMKATGEAEKLCAMLCIEGKVAAVYSNDSDLVAFGCPLTISGVEGYSYNPVSGFSEETYKCYLFKPVLASLNMDYKTFLDLCIMSGCDFNDNIFRVGIKTSFKILKECKSIDDLPEKYTDRVKCLKHLLCRNILGSNTSEEVCEDELILNINTDLSDSRDRLEVYNVEDWITDFAPLYKNIRHPSNNFIVRKPSLNRSKVRLRITNSNEITDKNIVKKPENIGLLDQIISNTTHIDEKTSPTTYTIEKTDNKKIKAINQAQCKNLAARFPNLVLKPYLSW